MGAISIVALVLGVVAVVLLIAVLALTIRGGKKKNDSSVEIGQRPSTSSRAKSHATDKPPGKMG